MYTHVYTFIFFFKQKTAYEMRISDWSSDVCSSDLALRDGSTMMAQQGSIGRQLVDWLAARGPGEKTFELGGQEFVGRSATPTPESIGRVSRLEIGRASGRERVCQYG